MENVTVDIEPVDRALSNGYNYDIENLLKQKAQLLSSYRWMTSHESSILRTRKKYFNVITNVISSLVGSGSAIHLITDYETMPVSDIVLSTLMIFSSVVGTLNNTMDLKDKFSALELRSAKFLELYNSIQNLLLTDKKKRPPADMFLNQLNLELEYNNGMDSLISPGTKKAYEEELKKENKNDLYNPLKIATLTPRASSPKKLLTKQDCNSP